MAFGKHKLCPNLSPKKSVEGAVGGVIGSVVLCGIFGYFALPDAFVMTLIIGFLGSIFAQLTETCLHQLLNVRWESRITGTLFLGTGGILDRFDSVLFTAPLVYYCILFINIG